MKITYSEIKAIRDILAETGDYWREIVAGIANDESDLSSGDWRVIADAEIDEIQTEELASDTYILGCFNADFIADVMDWPVELVEAAQKGDTFDAIGQAIVNVGKVSDMQQAYQSADGYGHHFGHYDGNDNELVIGGQLFHFFRTN